MKQYLDLMQKVLEEGHMSENRTGVRAWSLFGHQMRYKLADGFPLVTTKEVHLKSIIHELLWFISGSTSTAYLKDNGVKIWDAWSKDGELGPIYGKQWRSWRGITGEGNSGMVVEIDQIHDLIYNLKTIPESRRLIVSAWNPVDLPDEKFSPQTNVTAGRMALAPCHMIMQFYTRELSREERLQWLWDRDYRASKAIRRAGSKIPDNVPTRSISLQVYQRSADVFLGVPFNIASYSLFLMMIGQVVNMVPEDFIHTIGDAHIYENHLDQVEIQLSRTELALPTMDMNPRIFDIDKFRFDDFTIHNYEHYEKLSGVLAI